MRLWPMAFLLLLPTSAFADVTLAYPQSAQCRSNISTILISGSRMRVDSGIDGRNYSMLFDGLEEMMTGLDHSDKNYHEIEVDEDALDYNQDVMSSTGNYLGNQMNAVQEQMKAQCAQMEKQGYSCANLPDLASMMKNAQAMSGQSMPAIEIKSVDRKETIAGMDCKLVERFVNGSKNSEECYVEPKDLLIPEKDKKYLLRNLKVMTRYSGAAAGLAGKLQKATTGDSLQSDPADRDILLRKICFAADGSEEAGIEVKIDNAAIDENSFEIPAGYKKMNILDQEP